MKLIKILCRMYVLSAMMAFVLPSHEHRDDPLKWVSINNSRLKVNGTTTVSKFSCSIKGFAIRDTLLLYKAAGDKEAVKMAGKVSLPVFGFDCRNRGMTRQLRKTLKGKEFPELQIAFLSLKKYPDLRSAQESIHGTVRIELAGVSKLFAVVYRISMDDQKIIHLVGNQIIRFSDFNLTPPRKLGGVIKANNQLSVEFQIDFKALAE